MNVLILGSGGREHALAKKFAESNHISKLYCAPGNPGTKEIAQNIELDLKNFPDIKKAVLNHNIDMVVAGPEDPLVNGLRDYFEADTELSSVKFVGPNKKGAALEGSKDVAKQFMIKNQIPTAIYKTFDRHTLESAFIFLETLNPPYVLKADGLAGGKGVLIINDINEAKQELSNMFDGKFGKAGEKVVIEEFLKGIELSVFILTDGKDYLILPEAKDYKRVGDSDEGLNTGGMGSVSPVPFANEEFLIKVEERIIKPTVKGLSDEGINYNGFVFIGIMNCDGNPYVIEYNVRMGDPETEVVVPRIKSDLLGHFISMFEGNLKNEKIEIHKNQAIAVVCVSGGYPQDYSKGFEIFGINDIENGVVFHAGTIFKNNKLLTNGGRVLAVTAFADDLVMAREIVYKEVEKIHFDNMHYRKDIGYDLILK